MSINLRIILAFGLICFFTFLIQLIKTGQLLLKYTLLWLAIGASMVLMIVFPEVLSVITTWMGIELPINGLFTVGILAIMLIAMTLTVIVSKQTMRIKELSQGVALMEKRIRELEDKVG